MTQYFTATSFRVIILQREKKHSLGVSRRLQLGVRHPPSVSNRRPAAGSREAEEEERGSDEECMMVVSDLLSGCLWLSFSGNAAFSL